MMTLRQVATSAADQAAKYYSEQKYTKHIRIVETGDIPRVSTNSFVYVPAAGGGREPFGERIVELPDDFARFEMRDARVELTAYVPLGSIARGAALARDLWTPSS